MKVVTRQLASGVIAHDLDYYSKGRRYRPCLGYNLAPDEVDSAARQMIERIHAGQSLPPQTPPTHPDKRFAQAVPHYLAVKRREHVRDLARLETICRLHLLPYFGDKPLARLTPYDGDAFIAQRLGAGASEGEVRREWGVLMTVLNMVEGYDGITNRLRHCSGIPQCGTRVQTASDEDIVAILSQRPGNVELCRVVLLSLTTGLRATKCLGGHHRDVHLDSAGTHWLKLSPPSCPRKGNPERVALTPFVARLFLGLSGPLITQWTTSPALTTYWRRAAIEAGRAYIHFHDLRRTFSTRLGELDIDQRTHDYMMGHQHPGGKVHAVYNRSLLHDKVRRAMLQLDTRMAPVYNAVNDMLPTPLTWRPHRDSNPGFGLESAGSSLQYHWTTVQDYDTMCNTYHADDRGGLI